MKTTKDGNNLILEDIDNFDLKKTFDCGQCFRWNETGENEYTGVINGRPLTIKQENDSFIFFDTDQQYFDDVLIKYFDFNTDYSKIDEIINNDKHIKKCITYGKGIRILNQDLFEIILSFIISANNNIPRIKK